MRFIAPNAGASRSMRYAARAALVAGSAGFACSSGTSGIANQADADGGILPRGGLGGSGGLGDTGAGGARAPGGNGGALNSQGGGGGLGGSNEGGASSGQECAGGGAARRAGVPCRTAADCGSSSGGYFQCLTEPPAPTCGNPAFQLRECEGDADCGVGRYCQMQACGSTTCVAACTDASNPCPSTQACSDGGRCVQKPCDETGAEPCRAGTVCDPTSARANGLGCAPLSCETAFECAENHDCAPTHSRADLNGCVQRNCTADAECDCGFCRNAQCEPRLGYCYEELMMPYGCVWPDEELV